MADSLYIPDPTAQNTLVQPWDEAFRAQRDVGLLVPINFHTVPAISLRAACFSTNQYEDSAFQKCFSNLLAVGLRRFVIDTYWDAPRGEWSLCPAEVPSSSTPGASPTVSSFTISSSQSSTSEGVAATTSLVRRQDESSESSSGSTASGPSPSSVTSSSSAVSSSAPTQAPTEAGMLYQLGDYNCTSTMTLDYLTGIFNDFLDSTSTTTDASFTYLILNIHAASSWERPNEPAQQPPANLLPSATGNLLRNVINGNLSDELYTPSKLADERAQLGSSWHDGSANSQPRQGYYTVQLGDDETASTDNGWPDEAYVQFREYYRLISIFGTVDPQMAAYNLSDDADTIFPPGTVRLQNATVSSSGSVNTGCLFDASTTDITTDTNSSFAFATVPSSVEVAAQPDLFDPIPAVTNLTACGIGPLLNHTLANATADQNPLPYAAFTHSYLWTWAPGEPRNGTRGNRCAAAYAGGAYPGRWHVVDCDTPLRVACQDASSPYSWTVSSAPAAYDAAPAACTPPYNFSVPHTPLENAHLRAAFPQGNDSVLINLNSLDIADCWVAEVNGTCPYQPADDLSQTRIVVVPTVAAIIIFVCTALTFFVKCAANRREDKRGRRRRMLEGWEYEGVPS